MWKILLADSMNLVKQGFESEDDASEWIDLSRSLSIEDCIFVEMSEEEEEEFIETQGDDEDLEQSIENYKMDTANDDDVDDDKLADPSDQNMIDDDLKDFSIHEVDEV